jgi:hypothetical protein
MFFLGRQTTPTCIRQILIGYSVGTIWNHTGRWELFDMSHIQSFFFALLLQLLRLFSSRRSSAALVFDPDLTCLAILRLNWIGQNVVGKGGLIDRCFKFINLWFELRKILAYLNLILLPAVRHQIFGVRNFYVARTYLHAVRLGAHLVLTAVVWLQTCLRLWGFGFNRNIFANAYLLLLLAVLVSCMGGCFRAISNETGCWARLKDRVRFGLEGLVRVCRVAIA